MGDPKYTDEQLRDFARQVVEVDIQDPDFLGVWEQFEEQWKDLPDEESDRVHRKVHGLACSASVDVTFPGEPSPAERLAARLRALPTIYLDGVEAVPVADLRRILDEEARRG